MVCRPTLALIDELAHTNAEGGRHEMRWQDVEEVLAPRIDVFTTFNIQHIETLIETVSRITDVRLRETVPARPLEMAHDIELIDIPPDELLERLRQGKVYPQDQAVRALTSFFAKGNLTALREWALRAAADRVDAQLREYMAANAITGPWPTQEHILVCVNESPAAREAIRVAKRSADRDHVEWIAINVIQTRAEGLSDADKDWLAGTLRLAERLGAELATLEAERDVAQAILSYAADRNVQPIVIGRLCPRPFRARRATEDVADGRLRHFGRFEITLAAESDERATRAGWHLPRLAREPLAWGEAVLAVAVAPFCAYAVDRLFPVASLALLFMIAVVVVASRRGMGPSVLASLLGFLSYDFFFVDPRLTLTVTDRSALLTLCLFLAASLVMGNLAARLRARIDAQASIADRTNRLYDYSRRVAAAATADDVIWAVVSHVATILRCGAVLLRPSSAGELRVVGGFPPEDRLDIRDESAAQFAWDKGEPSGHGLDTLPTARWFFLPLVAGERRLGVLGIAYADDRLFARTNRRLLDALVDQIAPGRERLRLTEEFSGPLLASESERLRTPLVTIIRAAGSLADTPGLPAAARKALAENIREEGERLDRYVQNLLALTRIGHGAPKLRLAPLNACELIGSARHRLRAPLRGHQVTADVPESLPLVLADEVLLEQVLVNILDNAAKYAPAGSTIALEARPIGTKMELSITDFGPGIPPAEQARVFDMFDRVTEGDRQRAGTGLGLAICKGLTEAMGGTKRAETASPDGTGTRIVLSLPLFNPETSA